MTDKTTLPELAVTFGDIPIVVNPAVSTDEIWFVQPSLGPADKRTAAQRTTRVINVAKATP